MSMVKQGRIAKVTRPYELRARADAMDRTRGRITSAAIELHGTIGPAATTMSAVAERAGVTRATLYRHFPNEESNFSRHAALSGEARTRRPNPAQWAAIPDPYDRLAAALPALYGWYRSCEGDASQPAPRFAAAATGHRQEHRVLSSGRSLTHWTPAGRIGPDCAGPQSATPSPSRPGGRWRMRLDGHRGCRTDHRADIDR